MKRKLLTAVCVAFAVCLTAAGCAVKATDDELSSLENFQTPQTEHENAYLSQYVPDDGFSIDGIFDETVWEENGTAWTFEHDTSTPENPITMTSMSYLGEKGVYFAFSVKDSAIYYSADRTASHNTSVELYLSALGSLEWDGNSFRISVVPTGSDSCETEMRTRRVKTADFGGGDALGKTWALWYKAHFAGCHINGMGIDSSFNEGYDIELFIPYESLGLSEKPQAIQFMTAFYHVESAASNADAVWSKCYQSGSIDTLGTWLAANNETVLPYAQMADALNVKTDAYMTVDGVLDESVWKTEKALTYRAVNNSYGVNAEISSLAHFGEEGVYLAVTVKDDKIYATNSRNVKYNTGVEIWIQDAEKTEVGVGSVQLRVDALGNISKWYGTGNASYLEGYFLSRSAVKLHGATVENGAVAADGAEGFTVEIFLPYSTLGLSEAPDSIAVYPQYIRATDLTNTVNSNSSLWYFVQPASQSTAKTDSQNAFLYLSENDFIGEISSSVGGLALGEGERLPSGGYGASVSFVKNYRSSSAHGVSFEPVPVVGIESLTPDVTLTEGQKGDYEIEFADSFFGNAGRYEVRLSAGVQEQILPVYLLDSGFAIDGETSVAEGWNENNYLTYRLGTNGYGVDSDSSVSTLVRLGDAGVYVAVKISDNSVYATFAREIKYNSGVEIWIQDADNPSVNVNSVQLRIDALGNTETWIGTEEHTFVRGSFDVSTAVKLLGATAENGVVATNEAEGFQVEIYLPYSALGLTQTPESIAVFPQYVHAGDLTNTINSNSTVWSFYNPASQTAAKTDSKNAFLYLYDNDFASTLSLSSSSCFFGTDALTAEGEYKTEVTASKAYAATASHSKRFLSVPVIGAEFITESGVTIAERSDGEYGITLSAAFVERLRASGKRETVTVSSGLPSGAAANISFAMPATSFDGAVTDADDYSSPYYFYAENAHEMEAAVYLKTYDYGVSVALVLDSAYINFGTNATGNNGGGFEIRMASAVEATTGLWWRVFADGTARENTNLTQGAPSSLRTSSPAGSSAFAVGLVANDEDDLSLGYKQMTLEYFVEYSAIGASGAEDFFLAVGVNDTNGLNGTMGVQWLDGALQKTATDLKAEYWVTALAAENYKLNIASATAIFGNGTIRVATSLSSYTYPKGVEFTTYRENITEGARGNYALTGLTEGGAVPFTAHEKNGSGTVAFTVTNSLPNTTFDGAVTEADDYSTPYCFYAVNSKEMEVAVYLKSYDYGVSVALVMDSPYINYGTAATGNNGGGFEIRMANAVDATTGIWWRVFADGTAREQTDLTQGVPSSSRTATPVGSSAFAVGLVANDEDDLSLGYKQMTLEYFVEYSAIGASGAEDFFVAVGATATKDNNESMAVRWMDGSADAVPSAGNWVTVSSAENYTLSIENATAIFGKGTVRIATSVSPYTYPESVEFASHRELFTAVRGGIYTVGGLSEAGAVTVSVMHPDGSGTVTFTVTNEMPDTTFDGAVTEADVYGLPYSFYTKTTHEMEVTVYIKTYDYGVSVALVLDSAYINFGTNATGNNGGGFEIRMASAVDATTGLWWRVFADGTAREQTDLTQGVPSSSRTTTPVGSSAFAVGLVANDESNLSLGYKQMTLEYFMEYSAIGASGAEDFFLAVGANDTNGSNGTMAVCWMDRSAVTVPAEQNWVNASAVEGLQMSVSDVSAVEGNATFKAGTTLSQYAYLKGVSFTGAEVSEGGYGRYTVTVTEGTTSVTATLGALSDEFVIVNRTVSLDGAIGENEYAGSFTLSATGKGVGKDANDYATIKVHYLVGASAVYFGFDVTENTAKSLKNTGSGNQGTAGMDFAVGTANLAKANYYRAYASGLARTQLNFNGKTFAAPGNPATLDCLAGSYAVASGETVSDIYSYVMEWRIDYAAYGVSSADELYFLFGWINVNMADRAYNKSKAEFESVSTNTSGNVLHTFGAYCSINDVIALSQQEAK